jgi:hypothetical protein
MLELANPLQGKGEEALGPMLPALNQMCNWLRE